MFKLIYTDSASIQLVNIAQKRIGLQSPFSADTNLNDSDISKWEPLIFSRKVLRLVVLVCTLSFISNALAAPAGGVVTLGTGNIVKNGTNTTINQNTQQLAIDWQSFNIGQQETVRFIQPNASSIAVNRIRSSDPSLIFGQLEANGRIFLLNASGILFGPNARVNVGGLIATTGTLSDDDFLNNRFNFSNMTAAKIENQGRIQVPNGGVVALLSSNVKNTGAIIANGGTVLLAAGDRATLTMQDGSPFSYQIDGTMLASLVDNGGLIQADGGHVILTAKGKDALNTSMINHSGIIQAQTVLEKSGVIELLGDMNHGELALSGTLDASAPQAGNGGFVETSAASVNIADTTKVSTLSVQAENGNWLIDPQDYTIAKSGGNMSGATLSNNLNSTSVTIANAAGAGNGDIFVNDAVNWSKNTLTFSADRNIYINDNLQGSGTAKLRLVYGKSTGNTLIDGYVIGTGYKITLPSGPNFSTQFGSTAVDNTDFIVINDINSLQNIKNDVSGNYALGSDINASVTANWNGGLGFEPIGRGTSLYTGSFAGLGHSVDNLYINRPNDLNVGLFGGVSISRNQSEIRDVGIKGGTIIGKYNVGGLIGSVIVGLRTGKYIDTSVHHTYSTANVTGYKSIGGLIGVVQSSGADFHHNYATGTVRAVENAPNPTYIGGLIGQALNTGDNEAVIFSESYASGNVYGNYLAGGLIGVIDKIVIKNSYAAGDIITSKNNAIVSKFVNQETSYNSAVENIYASGRILGNYATAYGIGLPNYIAGSEYRGGAAGNLFLVQLNVNNGPNGFLASSFIGKSLSDLQSQNTYVGWDPKIWSFYQDSGMFFPVLKSLQAPLKIQVADVNKVYDATPFQGGSASYSTATQPGTFSYSGTSQGAVNVGSYAINTSYTPNANYKPASQAEFQNIDFSLPSILNGGKLTITPAPLTITATNDTHYTDDGAYAGGNGITASFLGSDSISALQGQLVYGGSSQGAAHIGDYVITAQGLSSNNYNINYANGHLYVYKHSYTHDVEGVVTAVVSPTLVPKEESIHSEVSSSNGSALPEVSTMGVNLGLSEVVSQLDNVVNTAPTTATASTTSTTANTTTDNAASNSASTTNVATTNASAPVNASAAEAVVSNAVPSASQTASATTASTISSESTASTTTTTPATNTNSAGTTANTTTAKVESSNTDVEVATSTSTTATISAPIYDVASNSTNTTSVANTNASTSSANASEEEEEKEEEEEVSNAEPSTDSTANTPSNATASAITAAPITNTSSADTTTAKVESTNKNVEVATSASTTAATNTTTDNAALNSTSTTNVATTNASAPANASAAEAVVITAVPSASQTESAPTSATASASSTDATVNTTTAKVESSNIGVAVAAPASTATAAENNAATDHGSTNNVANQNQLATELLPNDSTKALVQNKEEVHFQICSDVITNSNLCQTSNAEVRPNFHKWNISVQPIGRQNHTANATIDYQIK